MAHEVTHALATSTKTPGAKLNLSMTRRSKRLFLLAPQRLQLLWQPRRTAAVSVNATSTPMTAQESGQLRLRMRCKKRLTATTGKHKQRAKLRKKRLVLEAEARGATEVPRRMKSPRSQSLHHRAMKKTRNWRKALTMPPTRTFESIMRSSLPTLTGSVLQKGTCMRPSSNLVILPLSGNAHCSTWSCRHQFPVE